MVKTLSAGIACECTFCEQVPDRFGAWIVRFKNPKTGAVFELVGDTETANRPPVEVGRFYHLKVSCFDAN